MKIITPVVNNPIFIEIQYNTLKKYYDGDYEFIVFNDAKNFPDFTNGNDASMRKQIEDVCNKLNIRCINIPNEHHINVLSGSVRNADSMNFILNFQKENPDKYLFLDSDMFLIDKFNIDKYKDYKCAVLLQSRNNSQINYIWTGICYFDNNKIGDDINLMNWNLKEYCDAGGMMEQWLLKQMNNHPIPNTDDLRWVKNKDFHTNDIYFIKHLWSTTWNEEELPENLRDRKELIEFMKNDMRNVDGKFFCEIYDNIFFHYRAGCNWRNEGMDFHKEMSNKLKEILIK